ncbi:TIGR03943 family putative permease subunit [Heyndrickxia oleronia]|uniref:TIGR03943 family putative permease subunit n=1 Tax=Heyndrickxia oleronia TaxID=38875 RepID=UPI001B26A351|nr:TIGR03943 family protein [Heyndrickxia oleronia]GIN39101.1 UPF0703 protein YcgQ [Heyndrickxia oleronia]
MLRFLILLGFSFLFMHLHVTGSISKYINMKYAYISYITIFVMFFLTFVQLFFYVKGDKHKEEDCEHGCDHHHERNSWKEYIFYPVLIFPIISVFFIPIATLDSNIVKAKGFNFNVYNDKDASAIHQFLQPDSSIYYGQEGYDEYMDKAKKKFVNNNNRVILNDKDYLIGMETIYKFPGYFDDKTIQVQGFTYNEKELESNQIFLFRFGIIHCVADSGVFGMLVQFPDDIKFKNDEWIQVEGKLSNEYYQPFKKTIPILEVTGWKTIPKPEDPYVYRTY